jgi:hypothetical protein
MIHIQFTFKTGCDNDTTEARGGDDGSNLSLSHDKLC